MDFGHFFLFVFANSRNKWLIIPVPISSRRICLK
nr:MAG TPA: CarG inhibitor-like protein [Caudoviricetes sp.]